MMQLWASYSIVLPLWHPQNQVFDRHRLLIRFSAYCVIVRAVNGTVSLVRSMVELALEKEITFLAGSIAFFAFVSLVPAMVLILAIGSVLGGEQFAAGLVNIVEAALSDEGEEVLETALADTTGLAGASVAGFGVLFWSTLKVFRALDSAFDRIYQVNERTSLPRELLNGTIVVLSITTSLMVLLLVRTTITWLEVPYANVLSVPIVLMGLVAVLTPMYYVMPPVQVSLRSVLPGALFAVFGLLFLHQLFHLYASEAGQYQAYGFIGAVLLFLLWLYFGATILLTGAVINATLQSRVREDEETVLDTAVPVTPHFDMEDGESEKSQSKRSSNGRDEPEEEPPKVR